MKTLKNIFICCVSMLVFMGCQTDEKEIFDEAESNLSQIESEQLVRVGEESRVFNAKFVTSMTPIDEVGNCVAPYIFFNNQEGNGRAGHLGAFRTKITFCVNLDNLEYMGGKGTFYFDDGDELYFTISGQVVASKHPKYHAEFHDPFIFTGGTGKFRGARGGGYTNSFVRFLPEGGDRTDHKWKGTIILKVHELKEIDKSISIQ